MDEQHALLQGELFHRERGQKYLYVLDQDIGAIYCFKRKVNQIRSKVIILSQSKFLSYPSTFYLDSVVINDKYVQSFDFVVDKQTYAVMILDDQELEQVQRQFKDCSQLPIPLSYRKCCRFFRGIGFILSIPFKISNAVCFGLETFGDMFGQAPERVFKIPVKETKRFVPGNVASGLLMGTGKLLIGIAKGIGGLVYEPIKGAKENGFRGATKGLGKGILGLVCKPVAGTLELVTLTFRGVSNTPSSMYRSALKLYKKKKAKKEKAKKSINLNELEDCAPNNFEMHVENFENLNDNEKIEEIQDIIDAGDIKLIENDDLILPILVRNSKLREWLEKLSEFLGREEELLFEEIFDDDVIEIRVQEAKMIGKKLKKKIIKMIEELHDVHEEIGIDHETYYDFNSKMVSNLKEMGIAVKDEYVLGIASLIEDELLEDDEEEEKEEKKEGNISDASRDNSVDQAIEKKNSLKKPRIVVINPYIEAAKQWRPYDHKDNYRIPEAGPKGGIPLTDAKALSQLRSIGKEIIKSIGKKVLQGNFNLTTVSFPIKCMMPNTSLHNTVKSMTLGPLYFNRAALTTNPIERLKFLAVATMGTYRSTSTFLKPVILT